MKDGKRYQLTIELNSEVDPFLKIHKHSGRLHEALCRALHEGDDKAIIWLANNVADIGIDIKEV